jgi:5-methylcytosine-specific restriction endonuclease McrA
MLLREYLEKFNPRLSDVKSLIVKELWNSSDEFPRKWVSSSRLLELTGQKYFDRRIRELNDQAGADIETGVVSGHHHYRLRSPDFKKANPRQYLTESQKASMFRLAGNRCQVCGKTAVAGVRGLQADHKKPLQRGGSHDGTNWQAICNECNVAKRRACQGCTLNCDSCSWAYPETTGLPVIIRLPVEQFDRLQLKTAENPNWLATEISRLLS